MISQAHAAQIKHLREFTSEALFGATITRLLSREQLLTVGFDHVKIPRGAALEPHIHEASESFIYILAGGAIVTLDGKQYPVRLGDTIYIPPGVSHGFSTPETAVELLSVQSPPIYPEDSTPDIKFGPHA
jgi:mannose-6-phosphate isomerase-like protein (cupin superfamily)